MFTPVRWSRCGVLLGTCVVLGLTQARGDAAKGGGAERTNPPAAEFSITSWHTENGLPDGNITAIAQTPDGYLWVGTFKGLARFDGVRFTVFGNRSPEGLGDESIGGLMVDAGGRLWVGCESGELVRYEQGRFERMTSATTNGPLRAAAGAPGRSTHTRALRRTGMAEDAEGGVWMQLGRTNLLRVKGDQAQVFSRTNGLPPGMIYALVGDRSRQPWLLVSNRFYRWSGGKWAASVPATTLGQREPAFGPAREAGLWYAAPPVNWAEGAGQIFRLKDEIATAGLERTPWKPNVQRSQVTALLEDHDGRLWLGTHWSGVLYSDAAGAWQHLGQEAPLAQCRVTTLFEDQQGAIWVGTLGDGLHRVAERLVTALPLPERAKANLINTVCTARDGSVWVGTDGAGVFRQKAGGFTHFGTNEGLASPLVFSLIEDCQGQIWCGTGGGLFRSGEGRFQRREPGGGIGASVLALFEDRERNLWLGTGAGLVRHRDGVFSRHRLPTASGTVEIRSIGQDREGNIWVGTISEGLFCLRSNRFEQFGAAQGLTNPDARSVWCDPEGGVWVGTLGGGLNHLVNGKFEAITTADGLPDDTINSLLEDENGILWMGSYNGYFGCARHSLERYERGRSPALLCHWLNVADGLHFRTCSGAGQPVASRSAEGRLWFANQGSLASFTPGIHAQPRQATKIIIESVLVDEREHLAGPAAEVRVSSGAQRYEFHYTSPSPEGAVGLRFRHKLEGLDKGWFEVGARRVAYYNRIPPGRYKFLAMVGGPDGRWSESDPGLSLVVVPRLWERLSIQAAAVLGGLLALTGGVWGFVRARYRRRLVRLEAQQAMERERRRIAQDLHDDLGTSLTEISLLSAVARSPSASSYEVHTHLDAIVEKSSEMVKALDEIVWAANPKNDSVRNLINYLSFFAREYLQPTAIRCRLDVPASLPDAPLNAEQRHTLYLVVKEALANAAKHSGASELWLRVTLAEHALRIAVEDNGKGFELSAPSNRSGLLNLQTRMAKLGGCCDIVSAPGQGVRLGFELPLE